MELNRTKVNLKQNNGGECLSFYSQKILQFLNNKSVELIDRIGLKRILFPVILQYFREEAICLVETNEIKAVLREVY